MFLQVTAGSVLSCFFSLSLSLNSELICGAAGRRAIQLGSVLRFPSFFFLFFFSLLGTQGHFFKGRHLKRTTEHNVGVMRERSGPFQFPGCAGTEMDGHVGRDTNTAAGVLMSCSLEIAGASVARMSRVWKATVQPQPAHQPCRNDRTVSYNGLFQTSSRVG